MTGHLGRRVSALLDGHLSPAEAEAAWAHVHACHQCRDDVEREGWVKTRLSTLQYDDGPGHCAPAHLKGALLGMPPAGPGGPGTRGDVANARPRRSPGIPGMAGIAAIGGGAAGAAVMGVLALGATAPADLPLPQRRQQPISHVTQVPVRPGTDSTPVGYRQP